MSKTSRRRRSAPQGGKKESREVLVIERRKNSIRSAWPNPQERLVGDPAMAFCAAILFGSLHSFETLSPQEIEKLLRLRVEAVLAFKRFVKQLRKVRKGIADSKLVLRWFKNPTNAAMPFEAVAEYVGLEEKDIVEISLAGVDRETCLFLTGSPDSTCPLCHRLVES